MKRSANRWLEQFWREAAIAVAVATTLLLGIVTTRGVQVQTQTIVAPAPLPPAPSPIIPRLATLHRELGTTPTALDVVTIDERPTVVATLTTSKIVRIKRDDRIAFIGWAFDRSEQPATTVILRVGRTDIRAIYGTARPDVGKAYGSSHLVNTGFIARLQGRNLPRGLLGVTVAVVSADAQSYWDTKTQLTLDTR